MFLRDDIVWMVSQMMREIIVFSILMVQVLLRDSRETIASGVIRPIRKKYLSQSEKNTNVYCFMIVS